MNTDTVSHAASATPSPVNAQQAFAVGPHFHPFIQPVQPWWSMLYTPAWMQSPSAWDVWQRVAFMPWNLVWSAWQMADNHTAQALRRHSALDKD